MIRVVIENILLFLLPTAIYVGYVLLTRSARPRPAPSSTMRRWSGCSSPARCCVGATLIYYATITPGGRPGQVYTPPRMARTGASSPAS